MSITIDVAESSGVRVTDADVTVESDDTLAFTVEGVVRVGGDLLGQFVGSRLIPAEVALSADGDRVEIDLSEEAALRLEEVDVGVEMLEDVSASPSEIADDVETDVSEMADSAATEASDLADSVGRISFTVAGVVEDVPADAADRLADTDAAPRSLTFSVEDPVEGDGGTPEEPVASFELLGVAIAVRVTGTIIVTASADGVNVGPL